MYLCNDSLSRELLPTSICITARMRFDPYRRRIMRSGDGSELPPPSKIGFRRQLRIGAMSRGAFQPLPETAALIRQKPR